MKRTIYIKDIYALSRFLTGVTPAVYTIAVHYHIHHREPRKVGNDTPRSLCTSRARVSSTLIRRADFRRYVYILSQPNFSLARAHPRRKRERVREDALRAARWKVGVTIAERELYTIVVTFNIIRRPDLYMFNVFCYIA